MVGLVNNIIRLAALICFISIISMLIGWKEADVSMIAMDVVMLVIWATSEYENKKKRKESERE